MRWFSNCCRCCCNTRFLVGRGGLDGLSQLDQILAVGHGPIGVWGVVGYILVVQEEGDGLIRAEVGKSLDFGGITAEAGPVVQMGGHRETPLIIGQRLEHILNQTI